MESNALMHYGVKGMRWGVRRYQNADGTLTDAGKRKQAKAYQKELNKAEEKSARLYGATYSNMAARDYAGEQYSKASAKYNRISQEERGTKSAIKQRKKAEEWAKRYASSDKRVQDLDRKYYESLVEQSDIIKKISSDKSYITSYSTGNANAYASYKDERMYRKENGKSFWRDTTNTPTSVSYTKTNVHVDNEKNRKKYLKANKQRRKDYELYRTEVYYY